jgi:hypothetical protein
MPHKDSFSVFITTQHPLIEIRALDGTLIEKQPLLTDKHWYVAEKILFSLNSSMILLLLYLVFIILMLL